MARPGGDAIYEAVRALGVDTVFGIVSVHNIPIFDAVARRGELRIVTVRHEQAAVHAADAYARATGRLGVALASTGPGTTNTMTGLYEAAFASSPVMLITGQIQTSLYGRGKGSLHEAERQLEMLQTVCRRVESPRRPDEVVPALYRVAADVLNGRPQPGAVEIPIDLQHGDVPDGMPDTPTAKRPAPLEAPLTAAAEAVRDATMRIIWAGGGVVRARAHDELRTLAETLDAPVVTTVNGRGAIAEDHPLCVGAFPGDLNVRSALERADLVLAVGSRFRGGDTANYSLRFGGKLVHIDADAAVFSRNIEADVKVLGDAKVSLSALLDRLDGTKPNDAGFREEVTTAGATAREAGRNLIGPDFEAIMDHIRDRSPRDAVIVRDATVPAYLWGDRLLPVYEPGTSINPTSAAIGPGLPFVVGAAASGATTVGICGDGGFQLHIGELATAAQFELPAKIIVFNDGGYGVLRGIQAARYEGRTIAVDLATPDFAAVASAMGVRGERVEGADGFRAAFDRALEHDGPYLLDVDMDTLQPMAGLGAQRRR